MQRWGGTPPLLHSCPPYEETYGPEAIELAASVGLIADPWQEACVHDMLAIRPDGKYVCFECGIVVARQNGKGVILEIRSLAGLFLLGERLIMWSAHEYKTAKEGFRRTLGWIEGSDDLRRQVKKINGTHGEEGIELWGEGRNRVTGVRRLFFLARSKGSGRGFSGDVNLIDEAYAYTPDQQAALMPTMSARLNPQIVYTSSPPLDAATGEPMYDLRDRALAPIDEVNEEYDETLVDPDLLWCDWGADINLDDPKQIDRIKDPEIWRATNPAIGYRITEETISRELRGMSKPGFARERLCVWPRRVGSGVIDLKHWAKLADECAGGECVTLVYDLAGDRVDDGARCVHQLDEDVALFVDITPNRDYTSIGLVGRRADGLEHWELVDYRAGTAWVVERLVELVIRWRPVGVGLDAAGPAASLIQPLADAPVCVECGWADLEARDWPRATAGHTESTGHRTGIYPPDDPEEPLRGQLLIPSSRDVAAATGSIIDAIRQSRGRHIDQGELNLAVKGAKLRPLVDASAWGRRIASVDISPLVTITGARHVWAVRQPLVQDDEADPGIWFL